MAHQTVCMLLPDDDRVRLTPIIRDRSRPSKHIQRTRMILASDRQPQVLRVAETVGCPCPVA